MLNIFVVILPFALWSNTATATLGLNHGYRNWMNKPYWYQYQGMYPYISPSYYIYNSNMEGSNYGYPVSNTINPPPQLPSQPISSPNIKIVSTTQKTLPTSTVGPNQQTLLSTATVGPNQQTLLPTVTIGQNQQTLLPTDVIGPNQQTSIDTSTITPWDVTPVDQPICGTNYETYENMDQFFYAQKSKGNIRIFLRRTCPSLGVGESKPAKVQCIASCYKSKDNHPICGSDDVTYDNPAMLLCAQMCAYDVTIKYKSPCQQVNNSVTTVSQSTTNDEDGEVELVTNAPIKVPNVNNGNKPVADIDTSDTITPEMLLKVFGYVTKTTTEADEHIDSDRKIKNNEG